MPPAVQQEVEANSSYFQLAECPDGFEPVPSDDTFSFGACIVRRKTGQGPANSRKKYGCLACWIHGNKRWHSSDQNQKGRRMIEIQPSSHLNSKQHLIAVRMLTGEQPMVRLWKCPEPECGRLFASKEKLTNYHWPDAHPQEPDILLYIQMRRQQGDVRYGHTLLRAMCAVVIPEHLIPEPKNVKNRTPADLADTVGPDPLLNPDARHCATNVDMSSTTPSTLEPLWELSDLSPLGPPTTSGSPATPTTYLEASVDSNSFLISFSTCAPAKPDVMVTSPWGISTFDEMADFVALLNEVKPGEDCRSPLQDSPWNVCPRSMDAYVGAGST